MNHTAGARTMVTEGNATRVAGASPRRGTADDVITAIRVGWPLIAAMTLFGAVVAWLIGTMQPERYRAVTIAAIVPAGETLETTDRIRGIQALDQPTIVATVAAMASMPIITNDALGPNASGYSVRAVVLPSTNLLRIEVDGGDAARATAIANRVPPLLSARTRAIFGLYGVGMVSPAEAPELIFPRIGRIVAGGLVVGLLLGLTLAWLRNAMQHAAAPARSEA